MDYNSTEHTDTLTAEQEELLLRDYIHIKGARSNNLQNIELFIPKNQLVVVTGLSGSGKSSLIIDTLFAEGQRRYVESLSSYARQFLDRMKKPEVDFIRGICPAIAIEQKVGSSNARSTVGSLTEIYDYLRLLYARIGRTYSPISGSEVKKHEVSDVVDFLKSCDLGQRIQLLAPLQNRHSRTMHQELDLLSQRGYSRLWVEGSLVEMDDFFEKFPEYGGQDVSRLDKPVYLLIDRFAVQDDEDFWRRVADSVLTAFQESGGECTLDLMNGELKNFNNRFELDGMSFVEPTHQLFNYNNPYGACPTCEGYGKVLGIDADKVVPDDRLSIHEEAIACWRGEKVSWYKDQLVLNAHKFDFPIHRPYYQLTAAERELLWKGNRYFVGLHTFFNELEQQSYKIQNRIMLARYRGRTTCPNCGGGRLRKDTQYIKIGGRHIGELTNVSIGDLLTFFKTLELNEYDRQVADRILQEIVNRLSVMEKVGLSYLSLDRLAGTLSGGETQRINLTRTIGSNLTNSLYILDEPSVGLHPKDTERLVEVLQELRDLGNTVVVIEHEEEVIKNADYIIDIGPMAGIHGGQLVFAGAYEDFLKTTDNLTADYLLGRKSIPLPVHRRPAHHFLKLNNCRQHNLKNIDVKIPLQALTVLSGVSGSGKTSLVKHILYPALMGHFGEATASGQGRFDGMEGDLSLIKQVEMISQAPIGKSSRSNPVTYVKAYDGIRKLFAEQQTSVIRGYTAKHFSFNVEGGRCETCSGDGIVTVEMQFLADVQLVCDECKGQRFKQEVLEVRYKDLNINEVLNLSVEEAIQFFDKKKDIISKLQPLQDVGLGYIKLGQASSTLSGGEAQRVKLASFLAKEYSQKSIFFIFDEPTTGLHFYDVDILMRALNALVEQGHTVLVVEHNLDVIRSADWIIDLGPTGGVSGGHLLYQGPPKGILEVQESYTGQFLEGKL